MILIGKKVKLRPMTVDDKPLFFDMAIQSEATPYLYGKMYNNKIPSKEELFNDYKEYYFDGSQPKKGRCFAILFNNKVIGQINYNEINLQNNYVELDIWIAKSTNTGKGIGSDALKTLIKYLNQIMKVDNFIICPSIKNPRAIKAYQNAGFKITKKYLDDKGAEFYRMEIKKYNKK